MKNSIFFFCLSISFFSLSTIAQRKDATSTTTNKIHPQKNTDIPPNTEDYSIVSYHVEERVGKNVTIYNVSHLSLIETSDLGRNNIRIITPKYAKNKVITVVKPSIPDPVKITTAAIIPIKSTLQIEKRTPDKKTTYIMIDIISTYERIMEKGGYESVEMLKKVANNRYFKGDFVSASKWYSQLFAQSKELSLEYYYRYGQCLLSEGRTEKGKEMMRIFEEKRLSKQ